MNVKAFIRSHRLPYTRNHCNREHAMCTIAYMAALRATDINGVLVRCQCCSRLCFICGQIWPRFVPAKTVLAAHQWNAVSGACVDGPQIPEYHNLRPGLAFE